MQTEIGFMGYSIDKNRIPTHFMENIKADLYVKPIENPNFQTNIKPFPIFRISDKKVYLPRYYGMQNYGKAKINKLEQAGGYEPIELEFKGTLREVQQKTINATLKAFEEYGGGLISLDTGLGKTVVALKLVSLMKAKTLIIVHAEFLLDQWCARIKEYLPDARIGVIRQDKCEYLDKDIVVGMIQSITKREDYPKECFKSFQMLCVDEVHHVGSKTFSSIFYKVQTQYMFGLSATPERKDGLSKVIYSFIGPQIVHFKRETGKPSVRFVMNDTEGYQEKYNKMGKANLPEMITDLSAQKERNELIFYLIKEYSSQGRKILFLSERRKHCEDLYKWCEVNKIIAGLYLGGMNTTTRENSTEKQVILGTYQAAGEGFDVSDLDTLIMGTPKSDVTQAVGRILRKENDNPPLVVDIVDSWSVFKGQYFKRRNFYKKSEFNLI
jgi:superfamily II DNA or RNA helicase